MAMNARQILGSAAALASLTAIALAPATAAASGRGPSAAAIIRAEIRSYDAQLATVNAHVEAAIDEYDTTKDAATVEAAIGEELTVLRELESTLKADRVGPHPKIRSAKAHVAAGLGAAIKAYEHLANTFAELSVSPKAAKKEFRHYRVAIERAIRQIHRGDATLG